MLTISYKPSKLSVLTATDRN